MAKNYLYYQESGKIGLLGIFQLAFGLISASLLGIFYGYLTLKVSVTLFNIILTLLLTVIISKISFMSGHTGKVRHKQFMIFFTVLLSVSAFYFSWVSWIYEASNHKLLAFTLNDIIQGMSEYGNSGKWAFKGKIAVNYKPKGIFLYFIWLLQAAAILSYPILQILDNFHTIPFCEKCNKWTEKIFQGKHFESIKKPFEFVSLLESFNFNALKSLKYDSQKKYDTKIDIYQCKHCEDIHYLRVSQSGGKLFKETIVDNLILEKEFSGELVEWSKGFNTSN